MDDGVSLRQMLVCRRIRRIPNDYWAQLWQCSDVQEDLITFKRVMDATGDALMRAGSAVLAGSAAELGYEGALDEFGQRLCDSMAIFGAAHFHCLSTQEKKTLFLQQVGRQGSVAGVHFGFWVAAAGEVLLAGNAVHNIGSTQQEHGHIPCSHCLSTPERKTLSP